MSAMPKSVDLMELMTTRRSIRRFVDRPVPDTVITELVNAARWAPSAHNRQPWRFVVIKDTPVRIQLAQAMSAKLIEDSRADGRDEEATQRDARRSYDRLTSAPMHILVCLSMHDMDHYPDRTRQRAEYRMAVQSTAMAAQNLLLAAHASGLGACWMCAPLFCPEIVVSSLDLPADFEPQGLIVMGYPAENRTRDRNPVDTIVLYR